MRSVFAALQPLSFDNSTWWKQ